MGQESYGTASRGNVKWWPAQTPRGCAQRRGHVVGRDHLPFLPSWLPACNGRPSRIPARAPPRNAGLGSGGSSSICTEVRATPKPGRCNKAKEE